MTALIDAVRTLALARMDRANAKSEIGALQEAFDRANDDLIQHVVVCAQAESEAERTVRALAVSEYEATANAKPCEGVSIVLSKVLDYKPEEATAWALGAMPGLIVPAHIDVKAFDKVARAVPLPFVKITETPSVRIASALPEAL